MNSLESSPARQRATYDDLLQVPGHLVAEIMDGVLYSQARPALRHSHTTSQIIGHISGPFDLGSGGPGGWIILVEPEIHLGKDVIVPDVAGWRRDRMASVPDMAYADLAPDWVCEVLSPSTCKLDRTRKMAVCAREFVKHVWLVDPNHQTLEVYRLAGEFWALVGASMDDAVVRAEPFDAIEISLATLWSNSQPA